MIRRLSVLLFFGVLVGIGCSSATPDNGPNSNGPAAGSSGSSGSGGTAGAGQGGNAGTAGQGGNAGTAGQGGNTVIAGAGGTAGAAGQGGTAGAAGQGGNAGAAGTGGTAGAAGQGGNAGASGAGGGPLGPLAPFMDPPTGITPGFKGSVGGAITPANTLWGPGDVVLTASVTVGAGQTLTINPGTHISGPFGINATGGGTVNINGYYPDPVTMFNGWIALTGGTHTFNFFVFNSIGDNVIEVNGSTLILNHVQIQNFNKSGVYVHGAGAKLQANFCTIGSKGKLFTGDDVTKEGVSILIDATAANGGSVITNSVLGFLHDGTNTGLKIGGTATNTKLAYDFISGTNSVLLTTDKTGVFQGAPGITDIPNLDHNLGFFSPALDLADPSVNYTREPAPNGGRANMGYHGETPGARITSVEVVSPNGCDELASGATVNVQWHSSPNTGAKTVEFSPDKGATWQKLADVAAGSDTGGASVKLPAVTTDQALIRFSQNNDPTHIFDVSDRIFAVGGKANAAACAVTARCPAGTAGCKSFNTICYMGYRDGQSPTGNAATEPSCDQVQQDLTMLAPYTHSIRTYASNPLLHDGKCVPGITDALNIKLHMGIWIDNTYPDATNQAALDASLVIAAANHPSIKTIIVGNEYLLRVRQSFGDTKAAEAKLVGYIKYVRGKAPASIDVTTGESYPDWLAASAELWKAVDKVFWHVHPWWEQKSIDNAVTHVDATHAKMIAKMQSYAVSKPEVLAETGYPWGATTGAAVGSEANQARYLKDLNAYSVRTGLTYFFFEAFDENWKGAEGPVGSKWGMWNPARTTPHLVISTLDTLIPAQDKWPPIK
jgi:exo-beta-1,3-glucanase (GH17 family)